MKVRGETFSQTSHPEWSISVLVSCLCLWEEHPEQGVGARSTGLGVPIQQDLLSLEQRQIWAAWLWVLVQPWHRASLAGDG